MKKVIFLQVAGLPAPNVHLNVQLQKISIPLPQKVLESPRRWGYP